MLKLLSSLIILLFYCSSALCATQIKKTVCEGGSCDYTSLASAISANTQNLVTNDKYLDIEIQGAWSSADSTAVSTSGYTGDETRRIYIYATGSARTNGVSYLSGGSRYRLAVTLGNNGYCMYITAQGTIIDGIEVRGINNGNSAWGIYYSVGSLGTYTKLKNSVVHIGANSPGAVFSGAASSRTYNIINTILYEDGSGKTGAGISGSFGNSYNVYNCTVSGFSVGITLPYGTNVLKNVISYNNYTGLDYAGVFSSSSTNNLSKDSTAPAYNTYYTGKTLTFTNTAAGSEDFHLVAGDTDAIDKGADLSGTFTTDIDGETRTGTWDIGADEYVASGGGTVYGNSILRGNSIIRGGSIIK